VDPAGLCARTAVAYDPIRGRYLCPCLGQEVAADVGTRTLTSESPLGASLLGRLGYFSQIAILHYLLHGQAIPLAGRLVSPGDLASGQLYFRGSHVLPTDPLAKAFAAAPESVLGRGKALGGRRLSGFGDGALELLPLPRVPVTLVLWRGDDEFPSRASVLFDATCEQHLAPDVVWSVAMLCVLAFQVG
jgi:hypothetical protein